MIVVSDMGPVNYLTLLGHIDYLPVLYEQVAIPAAVARELSDRAAPQIVRHLIEQPPLWLTIHPVAYVDHETSDLGDGEREAIALA